MRTNKKVPAHITAVRRAAALRSAAVRQRAPSGELRVRTAAISAAREAASRCNQPLVDWASEALIECAKKVTG